MRTGRLRTPLAASGTVCVLAAAACGGGGGAAGEAPQATTEPQATAPSPPPAITIVPADGAQVVRPDLPVVVTARRGTLDHVLVRAADSSVLTAGRLSADHRTWRTRRPLRPDTSYTVNSTGTAPGGEPTAAASRFTTLRPAATFAISDVTPRRGEVVGVGMPLIVTFDRPITDRAAVERSLEVRMSRRVTGAWRWLSPLQIVYRPRRYWPAGERVRLIAHTAGVQAAPGVYGTAGAVTGFRVGAARISTVDTRRHRMTVWIGGRPVRTAGISAGRGGRRAYTTTSGVHLTMGRRDPVTMTSAWMGVTDKKDPRYYNLKVRYAVQISGSGEYVHSAPWSADAQGRANVSHGCVNAPPAFARWFYTGSRRGDVVTVTGTDRALEWNNGWGYWQMPWSRWIAGSALKHPHP